MWMRGWLVAMLALAWMTQAWAAGGYVYEAVGDVSIAVGRNAAHNARKNEAISSDTVINTGDKSSAILKFEDGQVVTLQANSSFQVREYLYMAKQPAQSSIFFSMLRGGMRFVTGLIGQQNKDAFRLATPNATIGIRGTDFMVAMVNNSMYSQVVSGSIGISNVAGTAVFTAGQTAVAASATALPTAVSAAAIPAGTFGQLGAIPVPSPVASPASAGGASAGSGASAGAAAGGAAQGGAAAAATTTATAGAVAGGISATTIGIGAAVAAGVAAVGNNTSTTTHH